MKARLRNACAFHLYEVLPDYLFLFGQFFQCRMGDCFSAKLYQLVPVNHSYFDTLIRVSSTQTRQIFHFDFKNFFPSGFMERIKKI